MTMCCISFANISFPREMDVDAVLVAAACAFEAYGTPSSSSKTEVIDDATVMWLGVDTRPTSRWWLLTPVASAKLRPVAFVECCRTHTQAWVFANGTQGIVAFRGTEVEVARDVLTDIDMKIVPLEDGGGAGVHAGFANAWRSVRASVGHVLATLGLQKIVATGHSLGAAIATLCAFDFPEMQLVTFGCPRVGDEAFVREFKRRGSEACRVTTLHDIVPHVPFCGGELAYAHVCGASVIHDGHVAVDDAENRGWDARALFQDAAQGVRAHLEPAYFDQLTKLAVSFFKA